jgi:hypothetical protein
MRWRVTSPQGAGQPQAGSAKRDAAVPHKNRMQVATVGRSADRTGSRPKTPSQDAPIFQHQCARSLKKKSYRRNGSSMRTTEVRAALFSTQIFR